jgi:hypothetical protein
LLHFRHPWRSDVAAAAYMDVLAAVPKGLSHAGGSPAMSEPLDAPAGSPAPCDTAV